MAAAKIPEDLTCDTEASRGYREAINNLLKDVLTHLRKHTKGNEIFVNCRLNRTDQKTSPSPVCVGWVESLALERKRRTRGLPDPAMMRFGDDHLSPIYAECICDPNMNVKARNYSESEMAAKEKVVGSRGYDVALGQVHRRYVCIKAGGRRAGTLTTGSRGGSSNNRQLENALKDWAQNSKKALVQYLEQNFELGGPAVATRKK